MHCLKFLLHCVVESAQKVKVLAIKMRPVNHLQAAKKMCVFWVMVGSMADGLP